MVGHHKKSLVTDHPLDSCDSLDLTSKADHRNSAKHSSNAFFFSLDYRLQQLLLNQLGKLAFHIRLARKDLWPLIVLLVQYLDDRQPIELRTAARSSLSEVELLDSYAVFYFKNYHFV